MDTVSGNSPGNNNKLIGSVEIPLSYVPASGLNKWWNLEKQPEKVIFPSLFLFASKLSHGFTFGSDIVLQVMEFYCFEDKFG